jgi:quercetin dioxygenase-like cupin family protein
MSATENKRTLLQKFDVGDGTYETLFELAEFAPNEVVQRHSHPGIEAGYVLEGECIFEFDGQSTRVAFKAGESYQLPTDLLHVARAGAAGAKVILVWVVEKGRAFRNWAITPPEA